MRSISIGIPSGIAKLTLWEGTDMKELYKNFDAVDSNGEILTIREKQ